MNIELWFKNNVWDFINREPPVIRIILLLCLFVFVVIPLAIPIAAIYLIKSFVKRSE